MLTIERAEWFGELDYDLDTDDFLYTPLGKSKTVRMWPLHRGDRPYPDDKRRLVRRFGGDKDERTEQCLYALLRRTNIHELMDLSGGDKWIIRRAIAMYNLGLYFPVVSMDYIHEYGFYPNPNCEPPPENPPFSKVWIVQ